MGFTNFSGSVPACEIEGLTYVGVDAGEEMSTPTIWLFSTPPYSLTRLTNKVLKETAAENAGGVWSVLNGLFTS